MAPFAYLSKKNSLHDLTQQQTQTLQTQTTATSISDTQAQMNRKIEELNRTIQLLAESYRNEHRVNLQLMERISALEQEVRNLRAIING